MCGSKLDARRSADMPGAAIWVRARAQDVARLWPHRAVRDCYRPDTMSNLWAAIASRQFQRRASLQTGRIQAAALYHPEIAAVPEIAFPEFACGRYFSRIVLLMPVRSTCRAWRPRLFTTPAGSTKLFHARAAGGRGVCATIGVGLTLCRCIRWSGIVSS